ncbi:hypothetical protein TI03_01020 [Achromatium sp. WMS1]|nr:hypothetical protein TI03_01020 [Achromatium sp. WMS1]
MVIQCPQCKTRFRIKPKLLENPETRLRCSSCQYIFTLKQSNLVAPNTEKLTRQMSLVGRTITFCNQKGGVAKTTSCLNIGLALSKMGKRVLCIDFDPQANLSLLAGHTVNTSGSFYDAITSTNKDLMEYILKLPIGLWLLPSNQRMNSFPKYALQVKDSEKLLLKTLVSIRNQFDFILIDTPPSLKFFTLNAIVASDCVVITSQCTYLAAYGVEQISRIINAIRSRTGKPKEPKLLLTLYNENSTAMQAVMRTLVQQHAESLLSPVIPLDEAIQEAQILRKTVFDYAPESAAVQAYLAIAKILSAEHCQ